jgi:hypothetical protein
MAGEKLRNVLNQNLPGFREHYDKLDRKSSANLHGG